MKIKMSEMPQGCQYSYYWLNAAHLRPRTLAGDLQGVRGLRGTTLNSTRSRWNAHRHNGWRAAQCLCRAASSRRQLSCGTSGTSEPARFLCDGRLSASRYEPLKCATASTVNYNAAPVWHSISADLRKVSSPGSQHQHGGLRKGGD